MSEQSDLAERLARRRARVATVMAVYFMVTQAISFPGDIVLNRPGIVHLIGWVGWAAALLVLLALGNGLLRGGAVRGILNDETTLDHRKRAMALGFWAAIATAFLVFALSFIEPISAREGSRLIVTLTIATALLRFGMLERRALRGE
jgi:cation transport ATPase